MSTAEQSDAAFDSPSSNDGLPLSLAGGRNPWLIAVIVSIATFMEVLDTSVANVALRHIAGSMAASVDESTWVLTSYLVSNAIVLPISGWLASVLGRKRFYMGCVTLFTFSSLLCGFAPSLSMLVLCRILQGVGGGGLAPSEQSILADSFTPKQHGLAFALYGVTVVVAPAIGPTLGGWITDNYSWRWCFFINVPIGAISLLLSHLFLVEPAAERQNREKMRRRGIRVDYVGFGLVALGLGCLQIVLDKGQREDWFGSNFIVVLSAVSAISIVLLLLWEFTRNDPIVDLPLLKRAGFLSSNVLMLATGFVLFGTTQLLPQLVQDVFGYTAMEAGLVITPGALAVMAMMPVIGVLLKRVQPRTLIAIGFLIEMFALLHLSGFNTETNFGHFVWARIFQAAGIAFLFVPISTVAYVGLPAGKNNNASALINLSRNLGGSIGISLVQTWLARRSQFHQSRLAEHLTPYDFPYRQALHHIQQIIPGSGHGALAVLDRSLQQQVAMLSYLDVFYLLALASLIVTPLVLLLPKTPLGAAAEH